MEPKEDVVQFFSESKYELQTRHGKAKARHRISEIDLEIANLQNEKAKLRNDLADAKAVK